MELIGHRGARREAPENTLGGFRHLRALGINRVELDLHLTVDHQLVVIHDATTDRTAGTPGIVSQLSADELSRYDARRPIAGWTSAEPVPTLDQVLEEWPRLASIQLEVKTLPVAMIDTLVHRLSSVIERHALGARATVTSHDVRVLAAMQHLYPGIRRGYVAERFARDPLSTCLRLGCEYLVMDHRGLNASLVELAHAMGIHVSAWTVNDERRALHLQAMGIDSLITDIPSRMLAHFGRFAHRPFE